MKVRWSVCDDHSTVRRAWRIAKVITWPLNQLLRRTVVGQHYLDDLPTDRPIFFIVLGHESYYDGFLFATLLSWNSPLLPPSFAAYTTVFETFGPFARWLGLVPISHPGDPVQTLPRSLFRRLDDGWPLAFFLDGGWNERDGQLTALRPIARLSVHVRAILVPVRLDLTDIHPILHLPRFWRVWRRPTARLTVGQPLNVATNVTKERVCAWLHYHAAGLYPAVTSTEEAEA